MQFSQTQIRLAVTVMAAAVMTAPVHAVPEQSGIARALRDPARGKDREQDARRHPAELIALAHIGPGQRVLDLIPGGGYWTRVFSNAVGPEGQVIAVWPQAYARLATRDVESLRQLAARPHYTNVTVEVQQSALPTASVPLDVVWTSQNYHDYEDAFLGKPGPEALARDAYRLLRPGGYFIVIDHRAAPRRGMADTETLHRIDPVIVRRQCEAAGFIFSGESRSLTNAADPLKIKVFDPRIRGRTSQFAFAFRKPVTPRQ